MFSGERLKITAVWVNNIFLWSTKDFKKKIGKLERDVPFCCFAAFCSTLLQKLLDFLDLLNKSCPIAKPGVCSSRSCLLPVLFKNIFDVLRFQWINTYVGLCLGVLYSNVQSL